VTAAGPGTAARPGPLSGARGRGPRAEHLAGLVRSAWARRLGVCVGAVLVLAVMTGPAGTNAAPTSGFTGSLQFPRLFWFVGFAAVLFVVVSTWQSFGARLKSRTNRLRASVAKVTASPRVRLGLDAGGNRRQHVWRRNQPDR